MSTAAPHARGARHLQLVGAPAPTVPPNLSSAGTAAWMAARPPLLRVCAGEPLLLTDAEVDLVELVNRARQVKQWLLDASADPDDHRLAEVLLEHLCHRYGIQRRGKGDRITNLKSIYRRHLLPFLVELDAGRPEPQRGVAALRLTHLEELPAVLAGGAPLPAATVAGDQLGRRPGIACIFLDLGDASQVVTGGARALEAALRQGSVPLYTDVRTGGDIVRAADLRSAGLLVERATPHGVATSTATNILRDLRYAIDRARTHGAAIRGSFNLEATEPLPGNRMQPPRQDSGHISLADVAATMAYLPQIGQVVLWLERLTGERISESFGPAVSDYWRDSTGQGWLRIDKQGGRSAPVRDPETGEYVQADSKDHTKTLAGKRTIPLPRQLADLLDALLAAFHTDAETGQVDPAARLIPGLQSEDTSGQSSFRTWLARAQEEADIAFRPHDLRGALITDLKNAGVNERLAHYYAARWGPIDVGRSFAPMRVRPSRTLRSFRLAVGDFARDHETMVPHPELLHSGSARRRGFP